MRNNNTQQGFTLIELSIVLVIIGLIVAGITGGQALVKSSELIVLCSNSIKQFDIVGLCLSAYVFDI